MEVTNYITIPPHSNMSQESAVLFPQGSWKMTPQMGDFLNSFRRLISLQLGPGKISFTKSVLVPYG